MDADPLQKRDAWGRSGFRWSLLLAHVPLSSSSLSSFLSIFLFISIASVDRIFSCAP